MNIDYNIINLPRKVTRDDGLAGEIDFYITFGGLKTRKVVTTANGEDRIYLGSLEYKDGEADFLKFGDGRLVFGENNELHWQYQIVDHLGNSVVYFEDKDGDGKILTESNTDDPELVEVLQRNLYYPFGMALEGTWNSEVDPGQDYLYNGKELEGAMDLNWHCYGFRMYDAAIGRFPSVDPISSQFPHVSPYNYAENMVPMAIDLWGLQAYIVASGQKNPGPTPETENRGYDNNYIANDGKKIASELGYTNYTFYYGVELLFALQNETNREGYIQNVIINGHGTETSLYGQWNAGFYSDNLKFNEPREDGVADVGNLIDQVESGDIKFADDAIICFLTCRAGKENSANIAEQITLGTGVTTIGASAGVNRNGTGSNYIYRAGKGTSYYQDKEAVWYKYERVNNPTKIFGITIKNNYSVKKTKIGEGKDFDVREYMQKKE